MRPAHALALVATAGLAGCAVTRWQAVQATADPAPAYITIAETGATYGPAPGRIIIRERFGPLEPRDRTYTFRFRKDQLEDRVSVRLRDWLGSLQAANQEVAPIKVMGMLKPLASPPAAGGANP
jgi:hypothetical protein